MKTQERERNLKTPATSKVIEQTANGASIFSVAAIFLSTLAFIGTGFTIYQTAVIKRDLTELKDSLRALVAVPNPGVPNQISSLPSNSAAIHSAEPSAVIASPQPITSTPQVSPTPTSTATLSSGGIEIQPSQFMHSAFGKKGQIELLSVKRIVDPTTGVPNVVNVQFRVRRLAADVSGVNDSFYAFDTTAQHPDTSETYRPVDPIQHSTGTISLYDMRRGGSADAYVWLRVPQEVKTLDISIPNTQIFRNVPIANSVSER